MSQYAHALSTINIRTFATIRTKVKAILWIKSNISGAFWEINACRQ
jgi:hypothetical protein